MGNESRNRAIDDIINTLKTADHPLGFEIIEVMEIVKKSDNEYWEPIMRLLAISVLEPEAFIIIGKHIVKATNEVIVRRIEHQFGLSRGGKP